MKSLNLILLILSTLLLITVIPGPCPQFFVGCRPGQPNDTIDCTDDLECDHNQRCCDSPCNGKMCFDTGDRLKPGECNDFAGIEAKCMEGAYENSTAQCHQDGDCPGDEKCCPQLCVKDLCKPPIPEPAQLICPKPRKDFHCPPGQEKKSCVSDSECGKRKKCCDTGCGYSKCEKPVPQPLCGPVTECKIFCPFGSVPDSNGCHTCECNPDPCLSTTCPEGQHCETEQVECFAPPCPPQPSCVNNTTPVCGPLCLMFCEFGNVLDERGCPICKCNPDPCENFTCSEGQHCEAHQVFCIRAPCPSHMPVCENNTNTCPPVCKIFCEYGNVLDENGCPTCQCVEPCKNVTCSEGQICQIQNSTLCVKPFCYPIGMCVNNPATPSNQCGPVCEIFCKFGNVLDANGCPTCDCIPDPCQNYTCGDGQHCEAQTSGCVSSPCPYIPACVSNFRACPMICDMWCEYGNVLDENLCPTCQCVQPCQNVTCSEGQICQVQNNTVCVKAPCYPIGMCVNNASSFGNQCGQVCDIFCAFGNVLESNGCTTCDCYPDPCQNFTCPEGQHCEPQQVECFSPSCPPQPSCVNNTKPCPPVCLIFCQYGNVLDKNGCPTCKCNPGPCDNITCPEGEHCEVHKVECFTQPCPPPITVCVNNTKFTCPPVCEIYCEFGNVPDPNGCPICSCNPGPCENFTCPEGQHCETAQVECFVPPCPPQPSCVNNTSPCPVCNLPCEPTYKLDSNGCSICSCNSDPCMNLTCPEGQHCETAQLECFSPFCPPQTFCVNNTKSCPLVCDIACEFGNVMENGCPICSCNPNPCLNVTCIGSCETRQVECFAPPCPPIVFCVNNTNPCPPVCAIACEFGHVLDNNGCPTCSCNPNPCANVTCVEGQHCETHTVECFSPPCPQIGVCYNNTQSCPGLCKMFCEYGFVHDNNSCPICECFQPCKDIECGEGRVCKPKRVECVRAPCNPIGVCVNNVTMCLDLLCDLDCSDGHVYDEDNCPTCECYYPCKNLNCSVDQVCRSHNVTCITAPCYPVGECVSATSTTVGSGPCPVVDQSRIACAEPASADRLDQCGLCSNVQTCCPHPCPGFGMRCVHPD